MTDDLIQIDWRGQFAQLKPFLSARGGVIHVRYAGFSAAPNAFMRTLGANFSAASIENRTFRLDDDNFQTRFVSGAIESIAAKIGHEFSSPKPASSIIQLNIGNDNQVSRDFSIDVANISVTIPTDSIAVADQNRRIWELREALVNYLAKSRLMIVLNASASSLRPFWREVWTNGFADLVDAGLVVVKMVDDTETTRLSPDEPRADLLLRLPAALDESNRLDAIGDFAQLLKRDLLEPISRQRAIDLATGHVLANCDSVDAIHSKWPDYLLGVIATMAANKS